MYINILLWHLCFATTASGITQKRDFIERDYYAVHLTGNEHVNSMLEQFSARLETSFPELEAHFMISVQKDEQIKRESSQHIKLIERQVPRQRHRRVVLPSTQILKRQDPPANVLEQYITAVQDDLDIHDPMFHEQWHLFNRREAGHDINVTGVWTQNITGVGTVVALVDDGIDMNSLDIADNYYAEGSYDFNDHNPVPSPKLSDDNHGTRCAGEIAAVRNDVCGIGIAYEGKVSGLRILSGRITDTDEALSLNYDFANNLIYSCSWGPPDDGRSMEGPGILIQRALVNGIQKGREGKGSIFVFASGNGAVYDDNCNFDGYTNSIFSITIGGIDRNDAHPYYSELCAPQLAVTYSSGAGGYIHTTDVGERTCSDRHGGTSAAAPIGAGIFALVLSIRPDLTWRDMQYLCVYTAKIFNEADEDWQATPAGFHFNHKFGYGKLDAWAMVELAKTWALVKPQAWMHTPVISVDQELGTEPHQEVISVYTVDKDMLEHANLARIEHITVTVNIDHQRRGDVTIDLISPHGIKSNLATARRYDGSAEGFQEWTLMTVKHWGEEGIGQWQLVVGDHANAEATGRVKNWRMTLWGECSDAAQAKALPMPGEQDADAALPSSTTAAPVVLSSATSRPAATTMSLPDDVHLPVRPTKVSATPSIQTDTDGPNTVLQPLPSDNKTWLSTMDWKSRTAIWLYITVSVLVLFVTALCLYLYLHRRITGHNRDEYEFKALRNNESSEPAGELYDAFAAGSNSDDDEDNDSQDSLDELQPLTRVS